MDSLLLKNFFKRPSGNNNKLKKKDQNIERNKMSNRSQL